VSITLERGTWTAHFHVIASDEIGRYGRLGGSSPSQSYHPRPFINCVPVHKVDLQVIAYPTKTSLSSKHHRTCQNIPASQLGINIYRMKPALLKARPPKGPPDA
jgi:hypothetical protein